MSLSWPELVTTALLGTDRRPPPDHLPGQDPPRAVLDAAARQRAVADAGASLPTCPAPERPVVEPARLVPPAATAVLAALFAEGPAALVTQWLWAADLRGLTAHPDSWTGLAGLAVRSPEVERRLLRTVLGEAGRWFLRQNPQWSRLAKALDDPPPPAPPAPLEGGAPPRMIEPDDVLASPELVFELRTAWTREHTVAALRAIAGGGLGWRARSYGSALGARMPLAHADEVDQAARSFADEPGGPLAGRRLVEDAFAACGRALRLRDEIEGAFQT
jgi:hypothetical protein